MDKNWRPTEPKWKNPNTVWKEQGAHTSSYHYWASREESYEAGANAIVEAAAIEAQKELVKELIAMLRPYGPKEMSLSGAIWLIEKHCKEKGLT